MPEITNIRIERIEDITEQGALAEGFGSRESFLAYFYRLYPAIKGLNPWVWVVEFKKDANC